MSAHEVQVAALESENRQLREQVAQMARDACRSSNSEDHTFGTELDVTPSPPAVIPPATIQHPKEPTAEIRTEPSPSRVLRPTAEGSVAGSVRQSVDVGAANIAVVTDSAANNSSSF